MNTPVSFELAKLLKEKRFNESCPVVVTNENKYHLISGTEHTILNGMVFTTSKNKTLPDYICSAPTIADVVMWLYKKHGVWVQVFILNETFAWKATKIKKGLTWCLFAQQDKGYDSPTEAYKIGIKFCLNNLIEELELEMLPNNKNTFSYEEAELACLKKLIQMVKDGK